MQGNVIPYYGRGFTVCGGGDDCKEALKELSRVAGEISSLTKQNDEWKKLKDIVCTVANQMVDENYKIDVYKLNILRSSVLPYISVMKTRVALNSQRFQQVRHLLHLLSDSESVSEKVHPGFTLLAIENVISEINREQSWWKSDFSTKLNQAVRDEWTPILKDNKRAIQMMCSKLALIGLMEIVRPIVLIWPLWMLISEVLGMVKDINDKKGLTPQSIMQLCKTALLVCILYTLVSVMALMPGAGYSCLGMAVLGGVVSSSDPLLKQLCPYIAPNLVAVNNLIDMIGSGSVGELPTRVVNMVIPRSNSSPTLARPKIDAMSEHECRESVHNSCRVEELDDDVVDVDYNGEFLLHSKSTSAHTGLRKRK